MGQVSRRGTAAPRRTAGGASACSEAPPAPLLAVCADDPRPAHTVLCERARRLRVELDGRGVGACDVRWAVLDRLRFGIDSVELAPELRTLMNQVLDLVAISGLTPAEEDELESLLFWNLSAGGSSTAPVLPLAAARALGWHPSDADEPPSAA